MHFFHSGKLKALEVKKNGVVIHDNVNNEVNDMCLSMNGKNQMVNCYTFDPCMDNNFGNAINTQDMLSLDFNLVMEGAETVTATIEILDLLGNM